MTIYSVIYLIIAVLSIGITWSNVHNEEEIVAPDAYLIDSFGRKYPLNFHTSFGFGRGVDHQIHAEDKEKDEQLHNEYDWTLFQIHFGEGSYYFRKCEKSINVSIEHCTKVIETDHSQNKLSNGDFIDLYFDSDAEFHFIFKINNVS